MKGLNVSQLSAGYGAVQVLRDLSFSLPSGTVTGVLGANGCGKTTLLKSICGILPHTGYCTLHEVSLDGLPARRMAQLCSYIPQRSGISIDISALDVVLMGFNPQLGLLEHPTPAMRELARNMLEQVGLHDRQEVNYLHLSEGQKQLCILARTLVSSASLLLMDEPESALDFHYRYRMLEIIRAWVREENRQALVSLHDPALALNRCDTLLLLKDGGILGTLRPRQDSLAQMEPLLTQLYGPVTLTTCAGRQGQPHIVMLKEREDTP
ncbi:MAG: ABC transporter ATP-binding protein [Clostridia bacterium]|nr:ABC transporter ATP-binding protein [Clostridia bacterium]